MIWFTINYTTDTSWSVWVIICPMYLLTIVYINSLYVAFYLKLKVIPYSQKVLRSI